MTRRWTPDEDAFVHAYFSAVGVQNLANDLGRTTQAVNARAQRLRECGAWAALDRLLEAERDYFRALGANDMDADLATIRPVPETAR